MQPLSPRVRAGYLYTFVVLFFAILPLAIFYADGWRWSPDIGAYKTGGVFISVPYQDADVRINAEYIGRSGFFDRSFYVGNLAPGVHAVVVEREGYLPWTRLLTVEEQLVTDADALLFPKRITSHLLIPESPTTTPQFGEEAIPRTQYREYLAAFATTTPVDDAPPRPATRATTTATTTLATTTEHLPQDEANDIGLFVENGDVVARWISDEEFPPSRFCTQPSICIHEIPVERGSEESVSARFFRGGVVYATRERGVYFVEMDVRPTPLSAYLFEGRDTDIRIIDDALIVKVGSALYRISL